MYAVHLSRPDPRGAGDIATPIEAATRSRTPLSKERILGAAVDLADEGGADAVSMRKIAQALGVVPMALYKHVRNKDELLDGMVDAIVGQIDPPAEGADWKTAVRRRILSARRVLLAHPWAPRVIEERTRTRTDPTPAVMDYMESMIGIFRTGGLSVDLTHHALHAMGSRLLGFSQELFEDTAGAGPDPAPPPPEMAERFPHITELVTAITHEQGSVVGPGCDDQFEFEFALDLLLNGLERLSRKG